MLFLILFANVLLLLCTRIDNDWIQVIFSFGSVLGYTLANILYEEKIRKLEERINDRH